MSGSPANPAVEPQPRRKAVAVCAVADLVPGAGVAARLGDHQVAVFYLPGDDRELYALGNYDPIGEANVLARGILGDLNGEPVVASPLYKHHFSLVDGRCLEHDGVQVPVYRLLESDGFVYLVQ